MLLDVGFLSRLTRLCLFLVSCDGRHLKKQDIDPYLVYVRTDDVYFDCFRCIMLFFLYIELSNVLLIILLSAEAVGNGKILDDVIEQLFCGKILFFRNGFFRSGNFFDEGIRYCGC